MGRALQATPSPAPKTTPKPEPDPAPAPWETGPVPSGCGEHPVDATAIEQRAWHALEIDEVLAVLDSGEDGLTAAQAEARLARFGPNRLPERKPPGLFRIVVRQFQSPLIYVLAAAAVLAASTGDLKDAGFIIAVLLVNAAIGAYQEHRAEQSSRALQKLLMVRANVLRCGEVCTTVADRLVPGDVVWLESGDRIPADLRLISAKGLEVDESLLTGESTTVLKDPHWIGRGIIPLSERRNMAFGGSMVVHGRSLAVVVATATGTAVGAIARDVAQAAQGRPPLVDRMERFSRRIGIAVIVAATIIAVTGIFAYGFGIADMLIFGIALAVSAIPEGLPVALTVALSVGTRRMAKRGVIVRRLAAVEGLGSCTLIASDKTGTLTCNELTVREMRTPDGRRFEVTGQGFVPEGEILRAGRPAGLEDLSSLDELARAMVLSNEGELHRAGEQWVWHGDPTDVALLSAAYKLGRRRDLALQLHPQVNNIPFEPERRYSATHHHIKEALTALVKGAPECLARMCRDPQAGARLTTEAEAMAAEGFRVLAFATGAVPGELTGDDVAPEPADLVPLGLVGMIDPPRPGVRQAIRIAADAGVRTIMVTGDHPVTALAIARDLGIAQSSDQVVTGMEIRDTAELAALLPRVRVFARVEPHQKLEIVQAARAAGDYVAVTGDGVNDAPALKAANIGVAMGRAGTDVAREAAELVITDDHYATITAGIEEGRIAYDNVRKVIYLLVSTGAAEVVLIGLAVLSGMPLPLLPAQILWLNLVTNGIQDVALGLEPGEPGVLKRPPRPPRESIFNRLMIERTVLGALVMGITGFAVFGYLLDAGWSEAGARNALLLLMVLFENVHILNSRSETRSAFAISLLKSPVLLGGALSAFGIHVLMMHIPFGQTLLSTEPLSATAWVGLVAAAVPILLVMELHKLSWWWRQRRAASNLR